MSAFKHGISFETTFFESRATRRDADVDRSVVRQVLAGQIEDLVRPSVMTGVGTKVVPRVTYTCDV